MYRHMRIEISLSINFVPSLTSSAFESSKTLPDIENKIIRKSKKRPERRE